MQPVPLLFRNPEIPPGQFETLRAGLLLRFGLLLRLRFPRTDLPAEEDGVTASTIWQASGRKSAPPRSCPANRMSG